MAAGLLRDSDWMSRISLSPSTPEIYQMGGSFYMTIKSVLAKLLPGVLFQIQDKATDPCSSVVWRGFTRLRPEMVHGTASVIDGKVVISDPRNDGSYATMIVPKQLLVRVFVNSKQVHGEVVLSESDNVDLEIGDVKPSITYKTTVSEDQLAVTAQTEVNQGIHLTLRDSPPSRRLTLTFDKRYTYPQPSTPEMILQILAKSGYTGTIDYDAVKRLCRSTHGHKEIVVRGSAPQKGQEARLSMTASFCVEYDNVFRITRCCVVRTGTTIAVVEPEKQGIVGRDVFNVPVSPLSDTKREIPKLGLGVTNVNGDIVATRNGRIKYSKRAIDVIPELKFERDISGDDGEVVFEGNIVVNGSIRDNAVVKAHGTVTVYGNIKHSSVCSNEGIFVQDGIHHSTIVAGHHRLIYQDLSGLLDKMLVELTRFADEYAVMVEYVMSHSEHLNRIPDIPAILFQRRHTELGQMLDMFVDKYSNELFRVDPGYQSIKQTLDSNWLGNNRFDVSQRSAQVLLEQMTQYRESLELRTKEPSVIRTYSVLSSSIRCAGNILIHGSCDASTIESENTITISKNLRGGFIVAEKAIYVKEVGTPFGVETSLRVNNPVGRVRIDLNYKNTLVEVGGNRYRSQDTQRDVRLGGSER